MMIVQMVSMIVKTTMMMKMIKDYVLISKREYNNDDDDLFIPFSSIYLNLYHFNCIIKFNIGF
jgi:hypothetical protein